MFMSDIIELIKNLSINQYILIIVVIIAGITDFFKRKVYNWLTIPAIFIGLIVNFLLNSFSGLLNSFIGLLIGFVVFLLLGLLGGMGGGDIKLMAAVGALGGWQFLPVAIYCIAISGGIIALIYSLKYGTLITTLKKLWRFLVGFVMKGMDPIGELKPTEKSLYIPYGLAISIGVIIAIFFPPSFLLGD